MHFEESDFKQSGVLIDLLRWWRQFYALSQKNLLQFLRRPFQTISILVIPSLTVIVLLLSNQDASNSTQPTSADALAPPTSLNGLGNCEAYSSNCLQIAFSPSTYPYDKVMMDVATSNGLQYDSNIKGFENSFILTVRVRIMITYCNLTIRIVCITLPELCSEQFRDRTIFCLL